MTIAINGVTISGQAMADEKKYHTGAPAPGEAARYALAINELLALRQYLQILAAKAEVSGIDLNAADSPLVR